MVKKSVPVVLDRGTFSSSLPILKGMKETFDAQSFKTMQDKDSKYLDQFREKNFSAMRHTFSNL